MRFDRNTRGEWIVDPDELARKLGIPCEQLKAEKILGFVHTLVVMGRGADLGRSQVTVQCREAAWQGVFDGAGHLIEECRLSPDDLPDGLVH
ncbi:DUF6522 family protein [Methylobacterium planeticum]|uniref:Uncharacterized protein n=1 Tax=Methylobacterium planeticum TaxID=2615211 RepID=A0A6N6MTI2_9HYPH|nr:DUF6522 family protein [Methylobacterium planeticum]KAB1073008.1 hypothetical protein F6X51_13585 [Methylobacterium planeticum]